MKKIKFVLAAIVAATLSFASFAQENGNRDANGYIVKGPYLTNGGGSNWFIGVGGGFNTTFGEGVQPFAEFSSANNWAAEAFIGKWFTPTIGVRAGYKGGMTNFAYDTDLYTSPVYGNGEQARFGYAHGDFMWNLSNALSGYKETRFWDIIPYAGAGVFGLNNGYTIDKFALNAGIYNKLRLGDVVSLYLDLNLIASGNTLGLKDGEGKAVVNHSTPYIEQPIYVPTATVGLTCNLGKRKNFDRVSSKYVPKADYEALQKKLAECENKPVPEPVVKTVTETKEVLVKETKVLTGSTVITFALGKSKLTNVEADKVKMFAESFKNGETLIKVVGSADSKTGTENGNKKLAKKRAEVVKNALINAGIAESRIIVDDTIDATDDVETSRSAIITLSAE